MAPRLVWRVDETGISQPETANVAARCRGSTHYTGGEGDYKKREGALNELC